MDQARAELQAGTARRTIASPASLLLLAMGVGLLTFGVWMVFKRSGPGASGTIALTSLTDAGQALRRDITRVVDPAMDRTQLAARNDRVIEALRTGDPQQLTAACNATILNSTEIDAFALFDASGEIVAINTVYTDGTPIAAERIARIMGTSFDDREIIQCIRNESEGSALEFQTTCNITPAFFDSTGLSVAYSVAVHDPQTGAKLGVASSRLRFERLLDLVNGRAIAGRKGSALFVTDAGGYFSEDINSGRARPPVPTGVLAGLVAPLAEGNADQSLTQVGKDYLGIFRLDSYTTLEGGGIAVLLIARQAWIAAATGQARLAQAGLLASAGMVLIAGGMLLRNRAALKEAQKHAALARDAAEAASSAKSEFLANMSHEIRTPMTAILGHAELMADPEHSAALRAESVATIRRNGGHLLAIINDILDLSKIEAGKVQVENIPCSPAQICQDVYALMNVRAVEKGLDLRVECGPQLPRIMSDPGRLRQIVLNLVGNAIKFTQTGGVLVRAAAATPPDAPEGQVELRIRVEDSGIGMTREQMDHLFKPFAQADTSTTRRYGGTGLGLLISQRLAALLNGQITMESLIGKGTCFILTLRARLAAEAPAPSPLSAPDVPTEVPAPSVAPVPPTVSIPRLPARVLLVEDGPDNRALIGMFLRRAGAQVEMAEDGNQGVSAALASAARGEPFDLILMDMHMPELDGYGATRQLREQGWTGPIVALTANAMSEDRTRCLEAGCDDYLTKPVDRARLIEVCATWAERARQGLARAA